MDNEHVRVLMIEDDEDDYVLTRRLLDKIASPRFEITWANTFDEGLEAAMRSAHDVVLVDYRLGAQTGVEFAHEAVARGCRSPIIMLTGQSSRQTDLDAMEAGAADYLEKDGLSARVLERSIRYALERRRAEEALRESEERFRTTFEQLTVGMAHTTPSGYWLRVNPKLCETLGYSADELRERNWQEMTHPDDLEADASQARQVVAGELESYSMEKRFIRKDGTPVWTHLTTSLVRDRLGEVKYGVAIIEDITARKQIEATLHESEARFRAMNESSPLGIFLTNPNGECVYTNTQYQTLTGLSFEEALGNGWSTAIYLEDRDRVFNEWYRAAEQQTLYESVHRYRREDGSIIWASVKAAAARDGDTLLGYVGTVEDITRRRETEEALRESEEKFRQLAENIDQVFWILEPVTQKMIYISPAYETIWGRSGEPLYNNSNAIVETLHPDDRERLLSPFARAGKIAFDEEFRIVRPDGDLRWVRAQSFPMMNPQGEIFRVIGVVEDITERKRSEHQRIELELQRQKVTMLNQFIGDASHDLRTPLTIMNSSLYLLRKSTDPERQQRHLDNLDEQVAHIQKLVEDLFTLSRLDMAASEFNFAPGDLNQLVQDVVHQQTPLAARKQHQMTFALSHDLPRVLLAPAELMVALRHLVVNAINYTPDGGQITLTTRSEQGQVVFEVRDNGVGIGADDLPLIFERFYRADKARNIETGGSGLGLTITKRIVEVHGGRVEVESTPGVGSTFRVVLPLNN